MITGFNTDIEYNGVTYHVQTEDKGLDTPLILSLVYDRGTILASKRSPYNDLINIGFNEDELKDRLNRQHKLICAAIRAGRIEDLKRMTMKESAFKKQGLIAQKEIKSSEKVVPPVEKITPPIEKPVSPVEKVTPPIETNLPPIEKPLTPIVSKKVEPIELPKREDVPTPQILTDRIESVVKPIKETAKPKTTLSSNIIDELKTEQELQDLEKIWDIPINVIDEFIFEEVEIIEEELILPSEAVEIITDFAKHDEPTDDGLSVELLNDVTFKSGDSRTISVIVSRDRGQSNLVGVSVMVKVLGTTFRPMIFHARTDSNGVAIIQLQLPTFSRGRAAILIKATSGNEEAELRRVIQPT